MRKFLILLLLLSVITGKVIASDDKNINERWLKNNNQELAVDKNVKYSIFFLPLNGGGEAVSWNNKKLNDSNLINILIMVETYNQKNQGKIDFEGKIAITKNDKVKGSSLYSVSDGTLISIKELVRLMVANNDNTAKKILLNKLGLNNINNMSKQLDLDDTSLKSEKESYTSVKDMSELFGRIYWLNCISPDADQDMLDIIGQQRRNDMLPALLQRDIKIIHSPDETNNSLHDCGIIYSDENDYILCIMTDNVIDKPRTINDIAKISQAIYDKVQ